MSDGNEMTAEAESATAMAGAASCPDCATLCEFELPVSDGLLDIACYECDHIFEIDAQAALQMASTQDNQPIDITSENDDAIDEFVLVKCMDCGGDIEIAAHKIDDPDEMIDCPHCHPQQENWPNIDDIDFDAPTRFDGAPVKMPPAPRQARSGIIVVSILSVSLLLSAALIALGLYFLTLRTESDVTRYIETNILQLTPAQFDVQSASYEISETDLGKSLLVTITLTNSGEVEGTPEEMKIILVDAQNNPLVTWPLDTTGQIITPGQTTQLYTRLFEPPEAFASLRVLAR